MGKGEEKYRLKREQPLAVIVARLSQSERDTHNGSRRPNAALLNDWDI